MPRTYQPGPPAREPANPTSPRDAAAWVIAERNRTRRKPRLRWTRVAGIVGTLLVHLLILIVGVLGSPYEPLEFGDHDTPLHVQLVDLQKPPPPPPPPVRGAAPKTPGPRHQGHAGAQAQATPHRATVSPATALASVPMPSPEQPVIAMPAAPTAPLPAPVRAPLPPISLPTPTPPEQQVPLPAAPKPSIAIAAPQIAKPVPPAFQPQPVRAPQAEGKQPMPPPASLASPTQPPAAPIAVTPPPIAIQAPPTPTPAPPALVTPAAVTAVAAPSPPAHDIVPLPAQPAPSVVLDSPQVAVAPLVPKASERASAPAIHAEAVAAEPVPAAPTAPSPQPPRAQGPASAPSPDAAAAIHDEAARPAVAAGTPAAKASATMGETAASTPSADASPTPGSSDQGRDVSTAPDARPDGSDTATPGQPDGAASASAQGQTDGRAADRQGNGRESGASTASGTTAAAAPSGKALGYIQLRPQGDTEIMRHGTRFTYMPTRFEKDWTPLGESSVDTALRHAVEKTTVSHTFHLAPGVRIKCVVMPLFPMLALGCGNGNPPSSPSTADGDRRLDMAPARPLAPTPASSSPHVGSAPIVPALGDSASCAAARISGGPLPPGCAATVNLPVTLPAVRPSTPRSSTSWAPASDQFH